MNRVAAFAAAFGLVAALAAAFGLVAAAPASSSTATLVVCAPGYPGTTAEAQPSLDAFATVAANAAGWPAGSLAAVYYPTEEAGVAALADSNAALALAAWPFFEKHAAKLGLVPLVRADFKTTGAEEVWSLVAKKGRVKSAAQLAGWDVISLAGYAPEFVRERALAAWGRVPVDTRIIAGTQVLSALRRAATGEDVAVLLDGTQTAGLASLPFSADLEIVAASPKVPVAVLCTVGARMPVARARSFAEALTKLHETPAGTAALEGIRLARFVPAALPAALPATPRTPKAAAAGK